MRPFQAILVEGTSGVGKSTLIDAMIRPHVSSSPTGKNEDARRFWTTDSKRTRGCTSLTADQIIERFESGAIANDSFHHADHVQLAFSYLSNYPVFDALQRFSCALKNFAAIHGKTQLYHETITCAYLFLIHERMARCESATWKEFARDNPDLLIWKGGILNLYYNDATLKSDLARRVFLLPDKSLEM